MTMIRRSSLLSALCSIYISVVYLSVSFARVTTPEQFFGYKSWADYKLANYEEIMEYIDLISSQAGSGNIILFGFNVQNRGQSHATFKLLFNAVYY